MNLNLGLQLHSGLRPLQIRLSNHFASVHSLRLIFALDFVALCETSLHKTFDLVHDKSDTYLSQKPSFDVVDLTAI